MTTLKGLLMHYLEVKESMRAPKTSTPQPESLRQDVVTFNPRKARDIIEYKWAFVCDVELYLRRIDWHDKLLIEGRVIAEKSWGKLIKEMNLDGRVVPKRYKHKRSLSEMFGKVIRPNAEHYFRERGYLR